MVIRCRHFSQDAANFLGREDHRQFVLGIGADQFQLMGPDALKGFLPEDLDGADGLGGSLAGDFFVALEVDAILADFLRLNQIGGFAAVLAELADAIPVGLLGAGEDGQKCQIIGV